MASGAELGEGFEENPLAIELSESAAEGKDGDGAEPDQPTAQPARAKLAKMQREGKDARAQVQKLQIENQQQQVVIQQQQDDNQQLQDDNQQLQEEIQQLEAQSQMDGDTRVASPPHMLGGFELESEDEDRDVDGKASEPATQRPAGHEFVHDEYRTIRDPLLRRFGCDSRLFGTSFAGALDYLIRTSLTDRGQTQLLAFRALPTRRARLLP